MDFRAPDELRWDFARLYELPRAARGQLRWKQFKFDRSQAVVAYPRLFGTQLGDPQWGRVPQIGRITGTRAARLRQIPTATTGEKQLVSRLGGEAGGRDGQVGETI